jgi:hypothetical protein
LWQAHALQQADVARFRVKGLQKIFHLYIFSCAALGGDGPAASGAVLCASGNVQVNGVGSREITILFPGDSIQTTEDSAANIIAGGSSVLVMPNSLVKFVGHGVELTEGGVSVATSEEMEVKAAGLTITPASQKQSKFEVAENDDSVAVAAHQGNLTVSDGQQTSTVPEGQETTRKKKKREERHPPPEALIPFPERLWRSLAGHRPQPSRAFWSQRAIKRKNA